MDKQQLPPVIGGALDKLTKAYSESEATTNAGRVLRFLARFVTVDMVLKILTHKNRK